jgi:hypothetical protein
MPFKKGNQLGNRKGRPKGDQTCAHVIRDFLSAKDPKTKKTRREMLVETIYTQANMGDEKSQKLLVQYDAGMPMQMTISAEADDETSKAMQDRAKDIFGTKRNDKK